MAAKWFTVAPGIRCREHETRKHGVRPDRYFTLRYSVGGRQVEEALGWASEGMTLERAQEELGKLRGAKRTGEGQITLREKRDASDAKRKADKRKAEEDARRNVTLATYFTDTYEPWAKATKAKAFKREEQIWRLWIKPNLGSLPIADIGMDQWDHLIKTLSAAGLSERSREYSAGTLRRILKHARERRVVTEAPPTGKMVGATAPKNNRRTRTLTDTELQDMLAALKARDAHAWRVTMFVAGTGCRASEAFNLRWGNVDAKAGTATFPKTKNGNARTVPLGKEIRTMLDGMKVGAPTARVFTDADGAAYTVAPYAFRAAVDSLKLNEGRDAHDRFTFHSLRHMAATRLAKVLPLRALMDVLGWSVAAMALRYSHTGENDRRAAAAALDAAFHPVEQKVVAMPKRRGA